jgi:hypothetical protein
MHTGGKRMNPMKTRKEIKAFEDLLEKYMPGAGEGMINLVRAMVKLPGIKPRSGSELEATPIGASQVDDTLMKELLASTFGLGNMLILESEERDCFFMRAPLEELTNGPSREIKMLADMAFKRFRDAQKTTTEDASLGTSNKVGDTPIEESRVLHSYGFDEEDVFVIDRNPTATQAGQERTMEDIQKTYIKQLLQQSVFLNKQLRAEKRSVAQLMDQQRRLLEKIENLREDFSDLAIKKNKAENDLATISQEMANLEAYLETVKKAKADQADSIFRLLMNKADPEDIIRQIMELVCPTSEIAYSDGSEGACGGFVAKDTIPFDDGGETLTTQPGFVDLCTPHNQRNHTATKTSKTNIPTVVEPPSGTNELKGVIPVATTDQKFPMGTGAY